MMRRFSAAAAILIAASGCMGGPPEKLSLKESTLPYLRPHNSPDAAWVYLCYFDTVLPPADARVRGAPTLIVDEHRLTVMAWNRRGAKLHAPPLRVKPGTRRFELQGRLDIEDDFGLPYRPDLNETLLTETIPISHEFEPGTVYVFFAFWESDRTFSYIITPMGRPGEIPRMDEPEPGKPMTLHGRAYSYAFARKLADYWNAIVADYVPPSRERTGPSQDR